MKGREFELKTYNKKEPSKSISFSNLFPTLSFLNGGGNQTSSSNLFGGDTDYPDDLSFSDGDESPTITRKGNTTASCPTLPAVDGSRGGSSGFRSMKKGELELKTYNKKEEEDEDLFDDDPLLPFLPAPQNGTSNGDTNATQYKQEIPTINSMLAACSPASRPKRVMEGYIWKKGEKGLIVPYRRRWFVYYRSPLPPPQDVQSDTNSAKEVNEDDKIIKELLKQEAEEEVSNQQELTIEEIKVVTEEKVKEGVVKEEIVVEFEKEREKERDIFGTEFDEGEKDIFSVDYLNKNDDDVYGDIFGFGDSKEKKSFSLVEKKTTVTTTTTNPKATTTTKTETTTTTTKKLFSSSSIFDDFDFDEDESGDFDSPLWAGGNRVSATSVVEEIKKSEATEVKQRTSTATTNNSDGLRTSNENNNKNNNTQGISFEERFPHGIIYYFKTEGKGDLGEIVPTGYIDCEEITYVRNAVHNELVDDPRKPFEIITRNRVYNLLADSEAERSYWVNGLNSFLNLTDGHREVPEVLQLITSSLKKQEVEATVTASKSFWVTSSLGGSIANALFKRFVQGPRHPDWSIAFEVKNQMLEDFFELSTELSWEEMRALSMKGVVQPKPHEIVSCPLSLGHIKLEFITSTFIKTPPATVLYLHGGGYCIGSVESYRSCLLEFSKKTGLRYLAVDYSLAPENPYPIALNECLEVYEWVLSKDGLNMSPSELVIGGDSAGAGLASALLLKIKEKELPMPLCGLMLCPWINLSPESSTQKPESYLKPEVFLKHQHDNLGLRFSQAYLGDDTDPFDPLVSPVYADLSGLPPLLIMAGSAEPLLGDIKMFYERCKVYGVDALYDEAETMAHVYMTIFQGCHEQADRAMALMASFVENHLRKINNNSNGRIPRSRSLSSLSSISNSLMDLLRNPETTTTTAQPTTPTTTTPSATPATPSTAPLTSTSSPSRSRGNSGPLYSRKSEAESGKEMKTFLSVVH